MIEKYFNQEYSAGVPLHTGDRYYSQDLVRDFWFQLDRTGMALRDIYDTFPIHLSGGLVTQGAALSLDITAGYGYAEYEVTLPDTWAATPPGTITDDVEAIRIDWGAKNDMNAGDSECDTYTVIDDNATVQYVKVAYYEEDGNARDRAKLAGSYSYEKNPTRRFNIDAVAPTDKEICLASFTCNGGVYTITQGYAAQNLTYDTITKVSERMDETDEYFRERARITEQNGGFWGDRRWKDADEYCIHPRSQSGMSWIGCILNNGKYLELTSIQTIKLAVPAAGQILDGITAVLNNEWYIEWAYENAGGALAFGLTWMPQTTIAVANPVGTITLTQVNAQDTGYLWPVDAHIALFQDTDEWETPAFASCDAGAVTYDASADKPKIASRSTTVLTLGADLTNQTFTSPATIVYVCDGFQPLAIDDGLIVDVIGARGYKDTGFRIRTTAAGAITNFITAGKDVWYANGLGGAADHVYNGGYNDIDLEATYTIYLLTYVPPDKVPLMYVYGADSGFGYVYSARHYDTYGEILITANAGGNSFVVPDVHVIYRLAKYREYDAGTTGIIALSGYRI